MPRSSNSKPSALAMVKIDLGECGDMNLYGLARDAQLENTPLAESPKNPCILLQYFRAEGRARGLSGRVCRGVELLTEGCEGFIHPSEIEPSAWKVRRVPTSLPRRVWEPVFQAQEEERRRQRKQKAQEPGFAKWLDSFKEDSDT